MLNQKITYKSMIYDNYGIETKELEGTLLDWGLSSVVVGDTVASESVGIVKRPDGKIVFVNPESIWFIEEKNHDYNI